MPWRPMPYGKRVLVFDTETTTDFTQRLLFGFFRVYVDDRLLIEGLIIADTLSAVEADVLATYAKRNRLPVYTREEFVERVFYPEVYALGTICVGFNLPFDLTRVAIHAGNSKTGNRFRLRLSNRIRYPQLYVESASARAAFIRFAPKKHLAAWEKPLFPGRFLDLSSLTGAFTGERHSLSSAGKAFGAHTRKSRAPELGAITRAALVYGRQDVRATWALYTRLRAEYAQHPFATFENERDMPEDGLPMGRIYSAASIAKQYLKSMGMVSLLKRQPDFSRQVLGYGAASYFGGRAEVRVRKVDVPITLLDVTSMYPLVFTLMDLQELLTCSTMRVRDATTRVRDLVARITLDELYNPALWPLLRCLVLVEPNGAVLPIRARRTPEEPYSIAIGPVHTREARWYTLADVIAAKIRPGCALRIVKAVEVYGEGKADLHPVPFRNRVPLDPNEQIFKTIVEQRQIAKAAKKRNDGSEMEWARVELGLKTMANSGAYGIFAEVNVHAKRNEKDLPGTIYSDDVRDLPDVKDERPGAFSNPVIASLVTGGARLLLTMIEMEVANRGGTFAFCDTDSLAIVCGKNAPAGIPCLEPRDAEEIAAKFEALNPYNRIVVPALLKREFPEIPDLRCFAISAKRYVLFRWRAHRRIAIVKASESGLGAIMGRTERENTPRLARRVWLSILMAELRVNRKQKRRAKPLIAFDQPLRRKLPISQPAVLKRKGFVEYNRAKAYSHRVKPFNFVQVMTQTLVHGEEVLPIAPFERTLAASRKLPWVDFRSGRRVRIDWSGTGYAGTVAVATLAQYIEAYRRHPEAKAAGADGQPCREETTGMLFPLTMKAVALHRIGKEMDRLDEDDGGLLDDDAEPVVYTSESALGAALDVLAGYPQEEVAVALGISSRRYRDIEQGRTKPHKRLEKAILRLAQAVQHDPAWQRVGKARPRGG